MTDPVVSIIADFRVSDVQITEVLGTISAELRASGLSHDVTIVGSEGEYRQVVDALAGARDVRVRLAAMVQDSDSAAIFRKAILDARGDIIAVIDEALSFRVREFEYAVAMVQADSSDAIYGVVDPARSLVDRKLLLGRGLSPRLFRFLVRAVLPTVPDRPLSGLRVFNANAAKLLFAESRTQGLTQDYEVQFLARKYGFRSDFLPNSIVDPEEAPELRFDFDLLRDVWRIRRMNAQELYRQARRCPICFSPDVTTWDQTNSHVIRSCRRCRCRYLSSFPSAQQIERTRNLRLRNQAEREADDPPRISSAKKKTILTRAAQLRRIIPEGSRLLEIGARRGDLGELLARDHDYVGIEMSDSAARAARARGVDVFCSSIEEYVNLGAAFDAVVMIDVFQHLPNPHEVLSAIKNQLKGGGQLVLVTPDTESFMSIVTGKRWSAYKVPEHVILYSRTALIELLENSGFEIVSVASDFHYFDHDRMHVALAAWPSWVRRMASAILALLPDPLFGSSGSLRVVARRRSGPPVLLRPVPSIEATHAR